MPRKMKPPFSSSLRALFLNFFYRASVISEFLIQVSVSPENLLAPWKQRPCFACVHLARRTYSMDVWWKVMMDGDIDEERIKYCISKQGEFCGAKNIISLCLCTGRRQKWEDDHKPQLPLWVSHVRRWWQTKVYVNLYPGQPTAHNSSASRLCTAPSAAWLACPTPPGWNTPPHPQTPPGAPQTPQEPPQTAPLQKDPATKSSSHSTGLLCQTPSVVLLGSFSRPNFSWEACQEAQM